MLWEGLLGIWILNPTMSNVSQNVTSVKKQSSSGIQDLFESMSYSGIHGLEDTTSIVSWLKTKKNLLSSMISGQPLESKVVTLKSELENIPFDIQLLNSESDIATSVGKALKASGKEAGALLDTKIKNERAKKAIDLIKKKTNDLVLLEAFTGQIPTWVVKSNDVPNWLPSSEDPWIARAQSQMETGPLGIFLELSQENYCMRDILPVLLAAVQSDSQLIFLVALNDNNIKPALPFLYLVDMLNNAGIRTKPIDVLLLNRKLLLPSLFIKLNGEGIKKKILVGPLALEAAKELPSSDANLLMEYPSAAVLNLANYNGKVLQHVIDSSADLFSAVSSVVRSTWLSGITINHRSRSLLFVHQPVYAQVLEKLKDSIEQMKVNEFKSEIPTGCDFVKRKIQDTPSILACISQLGAKTIPNNSNFDVPTVVYDIGTSSDIVANKEIGLGCLLIVIPYRSLAELFSLFNNQEEPDNVFIYANEINTTMDIIRHVKGREISVNGTAAITPTRNTLSWASFAESTPLHVQSGESRSSSLNLTLSASGCKEWHKLSNKQKVGKLQQLLACLNENPVFLPQLLSSHMDLVAQSTVRNQPEGVSGLVLINPAKIPTSDIVKAITACVLSERPVVVLAVNGKLSAAIEDALKASLPSGLVTIVNVGTYWEAISEARNLDLLWVIKGSELSTPLLRLPKSVAIKTLLINSANDGELMQNAEIVMSTAVRSCYM
ncbi:Aldehyde dehydrogenase 5, mitochondrial [Orchesella cincta]|uniref:Aldehyde dehydrogenase 5, mitochondrial n=1 Tax=Orchesella cincta TaxID=48709 RepID=A0A1D2MPD0_ORCCI|nr:Aldehyde dehydrogenase 5, mitochondrial [Orchesella cincta]